MLPSTRRPLALPILAMHARVLCAALIWGLACPARAEERSIGGASVQFPGPANSVEQDMDGAWQQIVPATDGGRALVFTEAIPRQWFTWPQRWKISQAPDYYLSENSTSIEDFIGQMAGHEAGGPLRRRERHPRHPGLRDHQASETPPHKAGIDHGIA
jgi:hypothetical protein